MQRFFVEEADIWEDEIIIRDPEEVNHLCRALRAKVGDPLIVSNGYNKEFETVIGAITRDEVVLSVRESHALRTEAPLRTELFQGLPKHGKMDTIVQKSVELGVHAITPVRMERTIPGETKDPEKRQQRWQKIAKSAAKQSGRGIIPEVSPLLSWEEMEEKLKGFDLVLFLNEGEQSLSVRDVLGVHILPQGARVALIVGPEGGFSPAESAVLDGMANCHSVTLGPRILRTETAGPALLAMLVYQFEL